MNCQQLTIDPKLLGPIMGTLVEIAHRSLYGGRMPDPEVRTPGYLKTLLTGWISGALWKTKKIKAPDDWGEDGELFQANKDWITPMVVEAIEGARAVQKDIERQTETAKA